MKRIAKVYLLCLSILVFGCNIESVEQSKNQISAKEESPQKEQNFELEESSNSTNTSSDEHCYSVSLIAGQHYDIGNVTVDIDGNILTITYVTNGDWVLNATHLHITNCEEDGFPTTGANNPKIGHFDYSGEHDNGTTEVIYTIDIGDITGELCFAAHAEVDGPSEETAWAEGEDFGGNSWAMYFTADLTDCDGGGTPPPF
ncbi:hypothetical protein DIS18_03130 [Algibacter marinivivus]|uniref:CHRD domain-containing protein n=1 Tax=Algibacter marinivivus TaxID=2100723 RepID=A0A2U2X732_9FLAO|nr:hypothetical protein [Algibacter marinivivus]PWH83562.1 hypothetical protein DIS18_03130 [Algibacter marinivivus]